MIRSPNDGVHLETPQAQTGSSSEGARSATSGNTPCAASPAEKSIPKIPHFFEIWPNIPIYLMFAVQISIPYQYTSFWGSGIPIYLMFSENSSNIPIYRMHDLGAQKGHTNIPHVFEKWPNIPIYLNLTSTRKLLQAHCYIGIYPT